MNVTVSMTDVTNSENEVLPDTLSKRPCLTLSPRKTTLTCSPCPKKKRHSRTGMEGGPGDEMNSLPSIDRVSTLREALEPNVDITAFQLKSNENKAHTEFKKMSTNYMILKFASTTHENTLIDFTTYFSLSNQVPQPEQSSIIFFNSEVASLGIFCLHGGQKRQNFLGSLYDHIEQKKDWLQKF